MNNWYINRLKTISIAEFPYRLKQLVTKYFQQAFEINRTFPSQQVSSTPRILPDLMAEILTEMPPFEIFGRKFDFLGEIDWHRDIFSGKSFPKTFAKKIDIKGDPELSAKVVWEINRLQFLPQLALGFRLSGDERCLESFISIVTSWQLNNPYLVGINWYSNIEVNLRLITWFICWEALDAEQLEKVHPVFGRFVSKVWVPLIYQHCVYSYCNPSKHSSANNHLISEYAGLFIAASKWHFRESEKWLAYSRKGLESEILRQHSESGINKEEAAEYIQFITDFFLLSYIVAENTKRPFSSSYRQRLEKIFEYISDMLDCAGNYPKYGDEDDGRCFIINFEPHFNNFKSLLTSAAILFRAPAFKAKSNGLDDKNQFLFGGAGKKIFDEIPTVAPEPRSRFYTVEGHFFFRSPQPEKETYLHFDAAPLGFLSIAAHGHADALSFILHIDGEPFLIDPGTYTYHTEKPWRRYFMGTLAHNTIRINKQNQALIAGPTLWLDHYQTNVLIAETSDDNERVVAAHNGYRKLGISHTREILYQKKQNRFLITDTLESRSGQDYFIEMPFHLHPSIRVDIPGDGAFNLTGSNGHNVRLHTDEKLSSRVLSAQVEPEITGWYSPSFMVKEPATTILCSCMGKKTTILKTTITIH